MIRFLVLFTISTSLFADSGKVLKTVGSDTFIKRNGIESVLEADKILEQGDEIITGKGSALLLLYPATQISLSPDTHIKISEHTIDQLEVKERAVSVIGFLKGFIKVMVTKDPDQEIDQRYDAKDVSLGVRGTEFELSESSEGVELDVSEGVIEVSSPHVQSFVPEIVKANEGLQFSRKRKNFVRRKFAPKFRDRSIFKDRKELLKEWKAKKKFKPAKKRAVKKLRKKRDR